MPGSEDRVIVAGMALGGADVADTAVTMLYVVSTREIGGPSNKARTNEWPQTPVEYQTWFYRKNNMTYRFDEEASA